MVRPLTDEVPDFINTLTSTSRHHRFAQKPVDSLNKAAFAECHEFLTDHKNRAVLGNRPGITCAAVVSVDHARALDDQVGTLLPERDDHRDEFINSANRVGRIDEPQIGGDSSRCGFANARRIIFVPCRQHPLKKRFPSTSNRTLNQTPVSPAPSPATIFPAPTSFTIRTLAAAASNEIPPSMTALSASPPRTLL